MMRSRVAVCCVMGLIVGWGLGARAADWPQWGGTDARNLECHETGLPDTFQPIKNLSEPAPEPNLPTNVKWVAKLGGATYGNPTVANGRVFVGTDDQGVEEDPRFTRTQSGVLKCFDEKTGELIWQLVVAARTGYSKELHYSYQKLGICSSPAVDGDNVYIVSSDASVLCLDVHGQVGGNRGPFVDEAKYMAGAGKAPIKLGPKDADIIWRYDLMKDLGVCPHDATSCSILVHGDLLYLSTSNGVNHPHTAMLAPNVPALIVLDKHTGKLVAAENEKICTRVWHCQWSPQSLAKVGDKNLVFFGGGDGICYAFEALEAVPKEVAAMKAVWTFDCNPPEYRYRDGKPIEYLPGDKRKKTSPNKNDGKYVGPSEVISTPAFYKGRVYVATGQDPLHGRGRGCLSCIDPTKTGNISQSGLVWRYQGLDRTIATPAVADGLVYIPDIAGRVHCVDAETGKLYWMYDAGQETWGSVLVADGKIFFGNVKDFYVMAAGKEAKVLSKIHLGSGVYGTPIAANGVLYVVSQRYLWAVQKTQKK